MSPAKQQNFPSVRLIITLQIVHLLCLILFYAFAYHRIWLMERELEVKRMEQHKARGKREVTSEKTNAEAKSARQLDSPGKWSTVLLGYDTIIPRQVFETSCQRVHRYFSFILGRRGPSGRMGPIGPVGDIGAEGPPGSDGRCNCSLPDLYVQRVPVPGPPIPIEKLVPVPVIVLKEMEVTKLVPFEPTPPGFAPPLGWVPGMPMPDQSQTRLVPPTVRPTASSQYRHWWSRPWRRRSTTSATATTTTATLTPPPAHLTASQPTTPTPYTGPPTLAENRRECRLNAVGIPVLHAESQYGTTGSWFRDSMPRSGKWKEKRWVTDGDASPVLYEYANERELMNKKQNIKYYVDFLASGTGSTVNNGSYFYHRHGSNILVRYDLESNDQIQSDALGPIASLDCPWKPDQTFTACNESDRHLWLYNRTHNYVDFAFDENGGWVIYMRPESPQLMVSKIEEDFFVVGTWQLDVNGTDLEDAFVMCGVLYGLESSTERDTFISFAFDMYRNESIFIDVPWYNPYKGLAQLSYNSVDNRLYFFDNGKLLSVNVRTEEPEYYDEQAAELLMNN
ncbi:hypothetical protein niasHT_026832 [Heterodera trifolii]|uniref:Olfactomedin-like domain-containing protein n=1 Tax=Heterodera trifolii TaxID=157864 RepID=A0ABD2K4B8_9BILA